MGTMSDLVLSDVRIWPREAGGEAVDVVIRDGRISGLRPHVLGALSEPFDAALEVFDGTGGVVVPAFADAHAHLDSTRLGLPFRPHTAAPGLSGLIENDRVNWRAAGASVAERATMTLAATIAAGTTLVRSHAQVDRDAGLERLEGVLAARDAHADRCRVQVVAFPQSGILRDRGTAELLDAALTSGADLVGGIDPCAFDRDPVRHLDAVFGLAERRQVGVDLHLHEAGELGAFTIELIAERTAAVSMRGRVTISHAFALSTVDAARQAALVELLAANDIAVTTVAPGNREPLPLAQLRAAGVRVGLGQDGIRDYWSPYGNGDMLDRAWQLAFRSGLRDDTLIEGCVDLASRGGHACIDGHPWPSAGVPDDPVSGLAVGAPAELIVVPADTVTSAVMDRPSDRIVVHAGRVVARGGALV
jgi:cytosine/adenosine deaminase-related metal-dependent hydrolase